MIRLVHLLRRTAGMEPADFRAHWRDRNGPLVAAHQADLDLVRYLQLHPDPAEQGLDNAAAEARGGMLPPYDGVAEYWWRSLDTLTAALTTTSGQAAMQALVGSEREFVDLAASPLWFAVDHPQVAATLTRPVARLRSPIMRLHFALAPLAALGEEEARRYWLEEHGPLIRSHAPARGLIAYNQVHRRDAAVLDAFAAPRGAPEAAFIGHAESWFERDTAAALALERSAAMEAALADERHFIDWAASTILVGKELVFVDREWVV